MSGTLSQSPQHETETEVNQLVNVTIAANTDTARNEEIAMAEKSKKHDDVTGKRKKHGKLPPSPLMEALTTVAHCCLAAFVLLILYLCFRHPFEFFTWHPLLLSIGWMLLMGEAILILSKENILRRKYKITHTLKLRLHWVPLTVAAVLIGIGFLIVTISKNRKNKYHYTSWHGLLGLIGVVTFIPPCINGVMTLYDKELRDYLNPRIVKLIHIITGVLSFACGGLSLILSVYTKWFDRRTNGNPYVFAFGLVMAILPVLWIVQRPLLKCVRNIYRLCSKEEDD
ncbi:hypothetical protein NQ315_011601 [Exocentrus adspersus]|uniref:ascorbate ferrireductase (transmembrane) n=1 Tax=Exocentrus adspersus TaxID=1586481 RepID=A0AAV8VV90_9CUCU|nr:hypothetical protein NQ315_011601 [Exocentrus adspersus]